MIGWLFNIAYLLLLLAAAPVLAWRSITQGKYRSGWNEKFLGRLPEFASDDRVVWLHAVSVGEVLQLRPLIDQFRQRYPDFKILITTTTATGHELAIRTYHQCTVAYCPLDFTWAVRTALSRVRPVLIGLVELELWPNLIRESSAARVRLVLINGRISQRSFRGYRHIRFVIGALLRRFDAIAVQTPEYASRLIELGAYENRITVTGSIKFDGVDVTQHAHHTIEIQESFDISTNAPVFIAGSTHDPEEAIALDCWLTLRKAFPTLRLIVVPRHQERFDDVAAMIKSRGLPVVRRSRRATSSIAPESEAVCLLDTLGELSACWGLADVAFVGGSLTSRGGQNMIEPAAFGCPIIVGPCTRNFRDIVDGLKSVGGITVVADGDQLTAAVRMCLADPKTTRFNGAAARRFVETQQGATARTMSLLNEVLGATGTTSHRSAA